MNNNMHGDSNAPLRHKCLNEYRVNFCKACKSMHPWAIAIICLQNPGCCWSASLVSWSCWGNVIWKGTYCGWSLTLHIDFLYGCIEWSKCYACWATFHTLICWLLKWIAMLLNIMCIERKFPCTRKENRYNVFQNNEWWNSDQPNSSNNRSSCMVATIIIIMIFS